MCLGVRDGLIFLVGHLGSCRQQVELRRRCIERDNEVRGDMEIFMTFRRIAVSFLACYGRAITRNTGCNGPQIEHHAHEMAASPATCCLQIGSNTGECGNRGRHHGVQIG